MVDAVWFLYGVALVRTGVSKVHIASIFSVTRLSFQFVARICLTADGKIPSCNGNTSIIGTAVKTSKKIMFPDLTQDPSMERLIETLDEQQQANPQLHGTGKSRLSGCRCRKLSSPPVVGHILARIWVDQRVSLP
jgi:hypothetical protein